MKLSQLRTLVAVADHGNFSEAAIHLDLSQSAVSHAIASLEDELTRGRHGAQLTPCGERVVGHARQVMWLLEGIRREATLERGLQGGQVRVASFRSIATHVLPAMIAQFRQGYPNIAVSLAEYPDVEQVLREGRADIGFTYLPTSPEFEIWEILRDEYAALLPPQPQISTAALSWKQLESYLLILDASKTPQLRGIRYLLAEHGRRIRVAYEVREDSTIVSMVAQGLGAAIMARLAAEPISPECRCSACLCA